MRKIARERTVTPPPHDALQLSNGPHGKTSQSMGQARVLHGRVCRSCGHALPPPPCGTVTLRSRSCAPLPQVRSHALHVPHLSTAQSTGHICVLQARCCASAGHARPPKAAPMLRTVRVQSRAPPPHVRVQREHDSQDVTTQSTGHGPSPHVCSATRDGHALPPKEACFTIERWQSCVPPPHVFEHGEQ